jgi:hypothetical protein
MRHGQDNGRVADHFVINKAAHPATTDDSGAVGFHADETPFG